MDKARIGALAISLFFVISIIASGLIYNIPTEPQQPQSPSDGINPTRLSMQADNIPATVVLLLPKLRVVAETKEVNINAIDSSISSIQGVKQVASSYHQPDQSELSAGLFYIADVFLMGDSNAETIISQIGEIPSLEAVDGFPYALVSLPEEIEFTNPDLNISRPHSLKGNESEALVSTGAILGDEIEVNISAVFIGSDALSVLALETKNITAAPGIDEASVEAEVASLGPKLLLDITSNYSQLPLLDETEQQLLHLGGILDFNLAKPFLDAKISLIADTNISEQAAADLNSFLSSLSDDVIFYNENSFRASLFFEQGTDLIPIEDSINEKLADISLDITLSQPIGHATAEIPLETEDASSLFPKIESLLESKGFGEFSLRQPGKIALTEVTGNGTGNTYSIESGLVESFFTQPHSIGETAQLDITYYTIREKIAAISAVEKE